MRILIIPSRNWTGRLIERDMQIRSLERELQSQKGIFAELLDEPAFITKLVAFSMTIFASETVHFVISVHGTRWPICPCSIFA
jgi:hypothetical protein